MEECPFKTAFQLYYHTNFENNHSIWVWSSGTLLVKRHLLIQWCWFPAVFLFCSGSFPPVNGSPALSVIVVVFFLLSAHVILCLQLTSYIRTIITRHKVIPEQFLLSRDQLDQLDQAVGLQKWVDVLMIIIVCRWTNR